MVPFYTKKMLKRMKKSGKGLGLSTWVYIFIFTLTIGITVYMIIRYWDM